MTEEPTKRLFSLILTAWRVENDQPQVAMRNMISLSAGAVDLEQEGQKAAQELFPIDDGWRDHNAFWTEITQGMIIGTLKLTWQAEEQTNSESEGTEK